MCGIFSIINTSHEITHHIQKSFYKGKGRGPEFSSLEYYKQYNAILGFHRLAINGLNANSNQPIIIDDIALICNGEIYNYRELYKMADVSPTTDSDCEIIIHLYKKYGIDQTLRMLDGVFAFILYTPNHIYVARDPYGVRPLYCHIPISNSLEYCFASELKVLSHLLPHCTNIVHFKPGHYYSFYRHKNKISTSSSHPAESYDYLDVLFGKDEVLCPNGYIQYHIPQFSTYHMPSIFGNAKKYYLDTVYYYLKTAVYKRCSTTERPIACLLSGGLDSSLIASLVASYYRENGLSQRLETYSIGLPDSEDVRYAKKVADYIGSNHTEIIVSEMDMINAIPDVIRDIESYDTTTVRASIGNWLIGKYISTHSDAKVIFNGDGSDELCGGYLYMKLCPDMIEYDKETCRLLRDIHMFDVLRSDKCISSHGLEPRTPFLDKNFVGAYLSIPLESRCFLGNDKIEKYLLRKAFAESGLLPDEILWRKKEAFSDGVSNKGRSLYQIIQEYIVENCEVENKRNISPIEIEKSYYKNLFLECYPNSGDGKIIPYYWMPKYTNETNDPSARTLKTVY